MLNEKGGTIMDIFNLPDLEFTQWILVIVVAFLVGISKTGLTGLLTMVIPVLAAIFGGKASTGIILPMLIVGDILALVYYKRHAEKEDILKLLPWTGAGLILGLTVGSYIDDVQFKALIAISVLLCLIILIYFEIKEDGVKVPKGIWFHAFTGILAGFTSMIGNAAGPIFSVYLLAKSVDKNNYLGITAWFFFIVNVSKLPLQIFIWKNIDLQIMFLTAVLIPAIVIGGVIGAYIVKKLDDKVFRYLIIGMTAVVSVKLFF